MLISAAAALYISVYDNEYPHTQRQTLMWPLIYDCPNLGHSVNNI